MCIVVSFIATQVRMKHTILCVQINHSSTGSTYEHATYITIVVLKKQFSVFSVLPAAYASDLLEYNEEVFPS